MPHKVEGMRRMVLQGLEMDGSPCARQPRLHTWPALEKTAALALAHAPLMGSLY